MGRKRVPTNILDARGSFKKNPQRRRHEPDARGAIGHAPRFFDAELRKIWKELVSMIPDGVLTKGDRIALEEMCRLVQESREDPANMQVGKRNLLKTYLVSFGLTPADRSKIEVPPPEKKGDFDEF